VTGPAVPAASAGPAVPVASLGPAAEGARRGILDLVASGALRRGQRLGAERDLAVSLGVSRSTLRQALGALEREGVVRRVPGRGGGTFVTSPKVDRDLSRIVGVPALLRDQGFTAGSRVVSAAVVAGDAATTRALGLAAAGLVLDIVRIRLADGVPISLERARLPAGRFPDLLEHSLGGSLYELLESAYGVVPAAAEERIEVVAAGDHEAQVLEIAPAAPLLSVTRRTVDGDGVPIEYSADLFRADRTVITVRTTGGGGVRTGTT
jgi:GntR family transcriptional regulator